MIRQTQISQLIDVVLLFALVLGSEAGCSGSAPAEPMKQVVAAIASSQVPGYVHSLGRSRFRIGQSPELQFSSTTINRWRGTLGTFVSDPTNGWVMASIAADAPSVPYLLDATVQNKLVRDYFVAAGIPAEQVADVQNTYQYSGVSQVGISSPAPVMVSVTSILRRIVSGVPVVESLAWAKMNTSGEMDMEYVFWPQVDASVVASAVDMKAKLSDATVHAAYLAKLAHVEREVGVVIHHTDPSVHAAPVAYASFDAIMDSTSTAAEHHFDANGVEFRLPQEQAGIAGAASVRRKP